MRSAPFVLFASLVLGFGAACGDDGGTVDVPLGDERTCTAEDLRRGCTIGACTLSGSAPDGTTVRIKRQPVPAELQGDALAPEVCLVEDKPPTTLTLFVRTSDAPTTDSVLFRHDGAGVDAEMPSAITADSVFASTRDVGTYGATTHPGSVALEGQARFSAMTSNTPAALVRNVTSQTLESVFFDGMHLFLGSGNRLLVYNNFPDHATQAPDVVLGQPTLDTAVSGISSSLWNLPVSAIWSDGTRLVVANRNRVLVYRSIPTQNFAPADIVLGQPDFSTNTANQGGLSASTLSFASDIQSDGTRLVVSDLFNNRVLVWSAFPTNNGEPASYVIGQPSFTSNSISAGATPMYQAYASLLTSTGAFVTSPYGGAYFLAPFTASNPAPAFELVMRGPSSATRTRVTSPNALALMPGGGMLVGDSGIYRIAGFRNVPTATATALDFVLGQPDMDRSSAQHPVSASSQVRADARVGSSGGKIFVTDGNRVLVWDHAPAYSGDPADRTLGHPSAASGEVGADYTRVGTSSLAGPADVSVNGTTMAIADRANHRVLLAGTSDPSHATVVLGQADFSSFLPNAGAIATHARGLDSPGAVLLDGTRLIVADTGNHRVLVWNRVPTQNGASPDVVVGQDDFTHGRPNHGSADVDHDGLCDADGRGMFQPAEIAGDGTRLFVADRMNHRVLVWDAVPIANGAAASRAIGQASLTANVANRTGALTITANGLNLPGGLALDGTSLWIADTENNRLVRWDDVNTAPTAAAFVGQASGTVVANPNYLLSGPNVGLQQSPAATRDAFVRPRGLALVGRTLVVSEQGSNRVHAVNADTRVTQTLIGQTTDASVAPNGGTGIGAGSLSAPWGVASDGSRVYVADENNHRVVGFDASAIAATANGTARASWLFGQSLYTQSGFNRGIPASAGGGRKPRGLAAAADQLFVAESDANRVLVFDKNALDPQKPLRAFGQPDVDGRLVNAGGAPSASTLASPRGVSVQGTRMAIADTGNNRVLVYDTSKSDAAATVVLGQAAFADALSNAGGAPSLSTLNAPEGVHLDGERLVVADTANHRVLVWKHVPTASGTPADLVLGQANGAAVLANRGTSAAGEATLDLPSGALLVGDAVWIADTGNNRVVRYGLSSDAVGATQSLVADRIVGQPTASDRVPASAAQDRTRLAGPVSLASDGVSLFVADRDGQRVAGYPLSVASAAPAAIVIDSVDGVRLGNAAGLYVERGPLFTTRMFVADPAGENVTRVSSLSRLLPPGR